MSERTEALNTRIEERLAGQVKRARSTTGELTLEVAPEDLLAVARVLRDDPALRFEMLMDVCGVDYLEYGRDQWRTLSSTGIGFSRGVADDEPVEHPHAGPRFAVAYHLLSITHNARLRLRVYCADDEQPSVDSLTGVWASADWFEREAFDLYGILFKGHPDLRRLLTDYGFIGHPFRKDFPLIGNVEVRYDPDKRRVVYQPVSIEPRTLVPKVIRDDHRYEPALKDRKPDG
jgi:NADH-quinone oxidoreductase subunit C